MKATIPLQPVVLNIFSVINYMKNNSKSYRELTKPNVTKDKLKTRTPLRPQININKNAFRSIIARVYKGFYFKCFEY